MRKIREVLRLKWGCGLSNEAVARSCCISTSTVSDYVNRAKAAGLGWPLPEGIDDGALGARLFPKPERPAGDAIPMPDWPQVHKALSGKGVTLQLLWREYRQAEARGYGYSQFCEHYRRWKAALAPTMRQVHAAGEGYVDYAGLKVAVVDPETGELRDAEIFVFTLGASSYIYAEAQWGQDQANWIGGHVRAFEHLGGVTPVTVPDNLRSGVTRACRYEPDLNRAYHDFAVYYGTAIVPARVNKPRDKAKVEAAVLVVERDVLAPLRHARFVGLAALCCAMGERLAVVNDRPMRYVQRSRRELLEAVDRPALLPLPERPFELADWKTAKVAIDYHVQFDDHFYSVPHRFIGEHVDIRATGHTVEVFLHGVRVASHLRSRRRGGHTTDAAHMPEGHRAYASWTPERFTAWGAGIGPATAAFVAALLASRAHPQQAFRSCLGVLRLADRFAPERLEAACRRAERFGLVSYKGIRHILEAGLDALPLDAPPDAPADTHALIRGADYYN